MRSLRHALLSLLASIPGTSACTEVGSCIPGTPGCVCDASNSCEPSLVCVDNRCVPLDETPGAGTSGEALTSSDEGSDTIEQQGAT